MTEWLPPRLRVLMAMAATLAAIVLWVLAMERNWLAVFLWFLPLPLVVVAVVVAHRRRKRSDQRRRAGLCVACAYDRHGLAADARCPECGASPS